MSKKEKIILRNLQEYVETEQGLSNGIHKYIIAKRGPRYRGLEVHDKLRQDFFKQLPRKYVIGFGKHKGKNIKDVPDGYFGWAVEALEREYAKRNPDYALSLKRRW